MSRQTPRHSPRVLVALAFCMALQMMGSVVILPLFARRFHAFGAGVGAPGMSEMAFALTSTVAAPFVAMLADRFERRRVILFSLLLALGLRRLHRRQVVASLLVCDHAASSRFGVWAFMDAPRIAANLPTLWVEVKERVNIYGYLLWQGLLAVVLWRIPTNGPLIHSRTSSRREVTRSSQKG
jgi:MFS family permease